ncbi:right-handed parallel beta-helix repeat-containing protein [Coraliomargarita algicola]|uniref:Right-handed parallel beta-helix repeat-containing protein n=1 Tax=Coraliomargarita algicola TaxID=3092156 RepID=A0ABZ0RI40_9BACT|nr:right-handed parallel beta-helix repeat-containing protein [Coraliomargarita sp. J2-16]WPJ95187.1 right-handed parallel beta-helix repeat-containing protein [Coraliomargarita sp. J2-16]
MNGKLLGVVFGMNIGIRVLLLSMCSLCSGAFAGNLIQNGDFSKLENGEAAAWTVPGDVHAALSYSTEDSPEGVAGSLQVKCTQAGKGQAQILQKISLPKDGLYYFEGWVNSALTEQGFVQIKLYKDKKEFQRISVKERSDGWVKISREFETLGADQVAVLLRYNQAERNVGNTVGFANLSLVPADERVRVAPTIATREGVPTFNSIGVYVDTDGDTSRSTEAHLVYRKKGTEAWRESLGMVWHNETRQFRGSLLNLDEDTGYEFKVWLTDALMDLDREPTIAEVKTWSSEVPIAKTIELDAGTLSEPLIVQEVGTPDGWIRITGSSDGETILDVDHNGDNAIFISGAQYVVLDNLMIKGGIKDAIVVEDSSDIRIRRCDISGWGQPGTLQMPEDDKRGKGPFYVDEEGKRINLQAGVRINPKAERVVVEDCYIHAPRGRATSWSHGHPLGPTSIIMANSEGNHVIRNNELIASDQRRFNDTIEAAWNNKVKGGPYRDTDISGNIMFFSNDDGIELDGGQMNVRMFNNWISSSLCGISTAPTIYGPSYLYRNLIVLEGEERGNTNFAFKVGGNRVPEPGINYIFHNTVYSQGKALRGGNWGKGPTPLMTRNNLIALGDILYPQEALADFDYDMLRPGSMDPERPQWQQNGVVGIEKFKDRPAGDYRLSDDSLAVDRGVALPMINEGHTGSAPDIGAIPAGQGALFPLRPSGISLLPMLGELGHCADGSHQPKRKFTVSVPPELGKQWRVMTDTDWIQVSPSHGPCDGAPHEIEVVIKEGLPAGEHLGAITIRTDEGYNRSSFIRARVQPDPLITFESNVVDLEHEGFKAIEVDGAPTAQVLEAPATREAAAAAEIQVPVNLTTAGTYYLHLLAYVPGPDASRRDSLQIRVDGGEPTFWPFSINAPSIWTWQTALIHKEQYPQEFVFSEGRHVITILGRETHTQLAKIVVSNSPLPPFEAWIPASE